MNTAIIEIKSNDGGVNQERIQFTNEANLRSKLLDIIHAGNVKELSIVDIRETQCFVTTFGNAFSITTI